MFDAATGEDGAPNSSKRSSELLTTPVTCSPRSEFARFHAANIGSQLDNRQRISPDSEITGISRLELNMRRPHRSAAVVAAEVIGLDFAGREGFLRMLGDPAAGTEHDRLADLFECTAPGPRFSAGSRGLDGRRTRRGRRFGRAAGACGAPRVGVPTLVVTAERRYPQP